MSNITVQNLVHNPVHSLVHDSSLGSKVQFYTIIDLHRLPKATCTRSSYQLHSRRLVCLLWFPTWLATSLIPRPCVFVACSTKFAQKAWSILSRYVCRRCTFMSHPAYHGIANFCHVAEISTNGVSRIWNRSRAYDRLQSQDGEDENLEYRFDLVQPSKLMWSRYLNIDVYYPAKHSSLCSSPLRLVAHR